MKGMCSCQHGPPYCRQKADKACPLCEEPFCASCLAAHHDCRDEPQVIDVPQRRVEEVRS